MRNDWNVANIPCSRLRGGGGGVKKERKKENLGEVSRGKGFIS